MSKTNDQIRERVETFVKDLEALIREAAVGAVAAALGVGGAAAAKASSSASPATKSAAPKVAKRAKAAKPAAAKPAAAKPAAAKPAAAKPAAKAAKGSKKRIRRSAKEIGAMGQRISEFIGKNPGLRAEQIKKALKLSDTDWALPIKKLVDERRLTVKGQKRATTYFVAK